MKVITEEELMLVRKCTVDAKDEKLTSLIDCLLTDHMEETSSMHEENGQIIVDELRPMSDKPKIPEGKVNVMVMVFLNYTDIPVIVSYDFRGVWPDSAYHGIGWTSLPIYRPKDGA